MDEEIWKPVVGYEGLYEVSNIWRIKSLYNRNQYWFLRRDKILKRTRYFYYSCVDLYKDWVRKVKRIHRLVALAFIPNPENKPQVCHISEKIDEKWFASNNVNNLFWWTASENNLDKHIKWRDNNLLKKWLRIHKYWKYHSLSKIIYQYSIEWDFIKEWFCISDASRFMWVTPSAITSSLKWRTNTSCGFIWKYK